MRPFRRKLLKTSQAYRKAPRDRFECFIDLHNHKLELLRTLGSITAAGINILIALKVFGLIH